MRVLVTWASKHGGTAGIGQIVAEALQARGYDIVAAPVDEVPSLDGFDAVILGGALYANRWSAKARRFVNRRVAELRKVPVWFFSSGPLDNTADLTEIPASNQVAALAERVGARGHVTFGGRLEPTVSGFPERAMAKTLAGDWRNPERIRAWAGELANELPEAQPGAAVDHPAHSVVRLLAYGLAGWTFSAVVLGGVAAFVSFNLARVIHLVAVPLFFIALAWRYFRPRGTREPLPTAAAWTALLLLLDCAVVPGLALELLASPAFWSSLVLVFLATWATGGLMSTLPWPKPTDKGQRMDSVQPGANHGPRASLGRT